MRTAFTPDFLASAAGQAKQAEDLALLQDLMAATRAGCSQLSPRAQQGGRPRAVMGERAMVTRTASGIRHLGLSHTEGVHTRRVGNHRDAPLRTERTAHASTQSGAM
jgi:hypothetical protein